MNSINLIICLAIAISTVNAGLHHTHHVHHPVQYAVAARPVQFYSAKIVPKTVLTPVHAYQPVVKAIIAPAHPVIKAYAAPAYVHKTIVAPHIIKSYAPPTIIKTPVVAPIPVPIPTFVNPAPIYTQYAATAPQFIPSYAPIFKHAAHAHIDSYGAELPIIKSHIHQSPEIIHHSPEAHHAFHHSLDELHHHDDHHHHLHHHDGHDSVHHYPDAPGVEANLIRSIPDYGAGYPYHSHSY